MFTDHDLEAARSRMAEAHRRADQQRRIRQARAARGRRQPRWRVLLSTLTSGRAGR